MKKAIFILAIFILTSCAKEPRKVIPTETTTTIEDRSKDRSKEKEISPNKGLKDNDEMNDLDNLNYETTEEKNE